MVKKLLDENGRKETRRLLDKEYPHLSYNAISILISRAAKELEEDYVKKAQTK